MSILCQWLIWIYNFIIYFVALQSLHCFFKGFLQKMCNHMHKKSSPKSISNQSKTYNETPINKGVLHNNLD
jgi:hypothetical protein